MLLTKGRDFVDPVKRRGSPPQALWVTSGNTANREMKRVLAVTFQRALSLLESGEALVELKR